VSRSISGLHQHFHCTSPPYTHGVEAVEQEQEQQSSRAEVAEQEQESRKEKRRRSDETGAATT
jgi:hypothetical protein